MKKKFINSGNMYLIGDIGNTDTKIFLVNHNFVKIKKIFLRTGLITNNYIYKNLKILYNKKIKFCLFSSVVPSAFKKIKNVLIKNYSIPCTELKKKIFQNLSNSK